MSTGAGGALGEGGAVGAAGAAGEGEVGEDGEAAFAAAGAAEEPSPVVTLGEAGEGADATVVAGEPVAVSDALPGPPPSATLGAVTAAVETLPIAPRAGPKSAGPPKPPPTAAPPTPGALPPEVGPVLAEVAVELPVPFVVFVGPNSSPVSAEMLLRAACACGDPNSCCAKVAKLGPGGPMPDWVTAPTGAAPCPPTPSGTPKLGTLGVPKPI
jgi:hypothetical protein